MDCISIIFHYGIEIQRREKEGRKGSDKTTCVFRNLLEQESMCILINTPKVKLTLFIYVLNEISISEVAG